MNCTFCRGKIDRQAFGCDCDDSAIACYGCRDYGCYRCKVQLDPVILQFCVGCKQHRQASKMYGDQFNRYCYLCCMKAYKTSSGKKVILCNHIFQPERFDVYSFLKKYCISCTKNLSHEKPQGIDSGLRQIYPLDNNLCKKCIQKGSFKENLPVYNQQFSRNIRNQYSTKTRTPEKTKQYTVSGNTTRVSRQSQLSKSTSQTAVNNNRLIQQKSQYQTFTRTASSNQLNPNTGSRASTTSTTVPGTTQIPTQTPQQKWKRVQNSSYIRCIFCDYLVLDDGVINYDMAICKYCAKKARNQEEAINLRNSREKLATGQIDNNPNTRYQVQGRLNANGDYDYYDPYKDRTSANVRNYQTHTTSHQYQRSTKQSTTPPKPRTPTRTVTVTPSQPASYYTTSAAYVSSPPPRTSGITVTTSQQSVKKQPSVYRQEPQLKKLDSQQIQVGVPLVIERPNESDQQYIFCGNCNIQLNTSNIIWEDVADRPLCRCCFNDYVEENRRELQRSLQYQNKTAYDKYGKYQDPTIKDTTKPQASYTRQEKSSAQTVYNSKTVRTNPPTSSPTQPQIIQQERKPANRVRKAESWDESILVEPVEQHQKRKREKLKNLFNNQKGKIQEDANQDIENQSDHRYNNNTDINRTQNSTTNVSSNTKEESVEPVIIDDEEQTIKHKITINKRKSWDQNIVLQPIAHPSTSKSKSQQFPAQSTIKSPAPQESKQQPAPAPVPKKQYTEQQNQPKIISEQQRRNRIKKMSSWDQAIVLEPIADHLERKRQKQILEKNTKVQERTVSREKVTTESYRQNQSRNVMYEGQKRQTSKSPYKPNQQSANTKPSSVNYTTSNRTQNERGYKIYQNPASNTSPYQRPQASGAQGAYTNPNSQSYTSSYSSTKANSTANNNTKGYDSIDKNSKTSKQEYDNFQHKYKQIKKQLDEGLKTSFNKLLGPQSQYFNENGYETDRINRRQQFTKLYNKEQNSASSQPTLRNSRATYTTSPIHHASPAQSRYVRPNVKPSDSRSTHYTHSVGNSRITDPQLLSPLSFSRTVDPFLRHDPFVRQPYIPMGMHMHQPYMRPQFDPYGGYVRQTAPIFETTVRADGLTGFTISDMQVNRICRYCGAKYTTTKDYYFNGSSACVDCYNQLSRRL